MIKTSLTVKIVAVVLGFSTLILTAILANNYFFSRNLIIQQAEGQSRASGREVALQLAALIKPVEQAAHNIALALEDASLTQGEISSLSHRVVANNIDIFAMSIAFEPYQFSLSQHYFAPYSYRVSDGSGTDGIKTTQSGNSDYHYFSMDWYQLPKELGQPVWTEPYFDRGGSGKLMTTYAVPFYRLEKGQKCFSGVVTANITLDWLQEIISSIQLYDTGYAAILSRHGTYIYHPIERLMVNETVFSLAEELGDQQLWEIGRSMIEGTTGFFERFS
ncbi:MAG: cache domain-containing protein, partial [Thermodesulfobacteriota bacterium]|nr:cache domain-containing protein [Thermodesulfobacteriota bacterium]